MIGKRVTRGEQTGTITAYSPQYKACITVTWDNGRIEGWFDKDGTDGTSDKRNHISISA
jgi:hypothetical protein